MSQDIHIHFEPPVEWNLGRLDLRPLPDPAGANAVVSLEDLLEINPLNAGTVGGCLRSLSERAEIAAQKDVLRVFAPDLKLHAASLKRYTEVIRLNPLLSAEVIQRWASQSLAFDLYLNEGRGWRDIAALAEGRLRELWPEDTRVLPVLSLDVTLVRWLGAREDPLATEERLESAFDLMKRTKDCPRNNPAQGFYAKWVREMVCASEGLVPRNRPDLSADKALFALCSGTASVVSDEEMRSGRSYLVSRLAASAQEMLVKGEGPTAAETDFELQVINGMRQVTAHLGAALLSPDLPGSPLLIATASDELLLQSFLVERELWSTDFETAALSLELLEQDIKRASRTVSHDQESSRALLQIPRPRAHGTSLLPFKTALLKSLMLVAKDWEDHDGLLTELRSRVSDALELYPGKPAAGLRACVEFYNLTACAWRERGFVYGHLKLSQALAPLVSHYNFSRYAMPWLLDVEAVSAG